MIAYGVITTSHQPKRTCLGCGARDDQSKLIRLVLGPKGELSIEGRGYGRGGYLHRVQECWLAFLKRKSCYRAFHKEISKGVKEQLIERLNEVYGE